MSNAKTVLLVRMCLPRRVSDEPDATEFSYHWAETVKPRFEEKGWQVLDLAVDDAVRDKVEELLQRCESHVFLFYGHGQPSQMEGQNGSAVINLDNIHLLKNQTVYVIACWTARILGREVADIVRCYLGYDEGIVWFGPYAGYVKNA